MVAGIGSLAGGALAEVARPFERGFVMMRFHGANFFLIG